MAQEKTKINPESLEMVEIKPQPLTLEECDKIYNDTKGVRNMQEKIEYIKDEYRRCLIECPHGVRGGHDGGVLKVGSWVCCECKYYGGQAAPNCIICNYNIKPHKEESDSSIVEKLTQFVNANSLENEFGDTPDYILAKIMLDALNNYKNAVTARDGFYGFKTWENERRD